MDEVSDHFINEIFDRHKNLNIAEAISRYLGKEQSENIKRRMSCYFIYAKIKKNNI